MKQTEKTDLTYSGPFAVWVADAGLTVEPGDTVAIPTELAASLLARADWTKAEKKATKESE